MHRLISLLLCLTLTYQGYYLILSNEGKYVFGSSLVRMKSMHPLLMEPVSLMQLYQEEIRVGMGMLHLMSLYFLMLGLPMGLYASSIGVMLLSLITTNHLCQLYHPLGCLGATLLVLNNHYKQKQNNKNNK